MPWPPSYAIRMSRWASNSRQRAVHTIGSADAGRKIVGSRHAAQSSYAPNPASRAQRQTQYVQTEGLAPQAPQQPGSSPPRRPALRRAQAGNAAGYPTTEQPGHIAPKADHPGQRERETYGRDRGPLRAPAGALPITAQAIRTPAVGANQHSALSTVVVDPQQAMSAPQRAHQ